MSTLQEDYEIEDQALEDPEFDEVQSPEPYRQASEAGSIGPFLGGLALGAILFFPAYSGQEIAISSNDSSRPGGIYLEAYEMWGLQRQSYRLQFMLNPETNQYMWHRKLADGSWIPHWTD